MKSNSKKLVFKDISDVYQNNTSEFQYAEIKSKNSVFMVTDRFGGISESFLKTTLHWHDYYELEIIYGGSGVHILGNSSYNMFRGFVCLRTPNIIHSTIQNSNDKLKLYNIKFSADYLSNRIGTQDFFSDNSMWVIFDDDEVNEINKIVERMFYEINNQDNYSPLMLRTLLTDILVNFLRKHSKKNKDSSQYSSHIQFALNFINNNFRGEINVNQIAQMLHLTPHYLGMLFIKEVGKPIINYVLDLRLTLAVQMLINTSLSIKEIAFESGFNNSSYFVKKFSERYGVSPLKYRLLNT